MKYPRMMLHAEIALGKQKSGGKGISYRSCIRKNLELFSINVPKGFVALQPLAQNRAVWQNAVKDVAAALMYNLLKKESKLSFERFFSVFLNT